MQSEKQLENLKKGKRFTKGTAAAAGRNGGIKSAESRAIKKSINEDLKERCTPERIKRMNDKIISMAERGNLKAYELVRDGLGDKPVERVEQTSVDVSVVFDE